MNSPFQIGVRINGVNYYARITPCLYNYSPVAFYGSGTTFYLSTALKDNNNYYLVGQLPADRTFDGNWMWFKFHAFAPNAFIKRAIELGKSTSDLSLERILIIGLPDEEQPYPTDMKDNTPYTLGFIRKIASAAQRYKLVYRERRGYYLSSDFVATNGSPPDSWTVSNNAVLQGRWYTQENLDKSLYNDYFDLNKGNAIKFNWDWESYSATKVIIYSGSGSITYQANALGYSDGSVQSYNLCVGCDANYKPIAMTGRCFPQDFYNSAASGWDALEQDPTTFNPNLYTASDYNNVQLVDGEYVFPAK